MRLDYQIEGNIQFALVIFFRIRNSFVAKHWRKLTRDGSSELAGVVQQPLPELVPPDAGGTHEDERPPLVTLGVVEGHLLVRRRLILVALERRVLSLSFVCFPSTEERGCAGFSAVKNTNLDLRQAVSPDDVVNVSPNTNIRAEYTLTSGATGDRPGPGPPDSASASGEPSGAAAAPG